MNTKTIFYINCTDIGSTGKIIRCIAAVAKKKGYRNILCAATINENDLVFEKQFSVSGRIRRAITYRMSKITGNKYGMSFFATRKLMNEISLSSPDVVHIHCANGSFINIYQLLNYLKKKKLPTVVTNHAEFFYTGNCDHAYDCEKWKTGCGQCPQKFSMIDSTRYWWEKMRKAFSDFPHLVVTSVSPWVLERSSASPIMEGVRQSLVLNGVDTEVFHRYETEKLWERYGIDRQRKRVILYVTACFYGDRPEKGSEYFLRLAENMKDCDAVFVVAGACLPDVSAPDNVYLLGKIQDQKELAQLYSAADLTLITSQRETFSMPVAESLCCGTPVVGFRAGGPESIALKEYTAFEEYGNVLALKNIITDKWLYFKTQEIAREIEKVAMGRYDKLMMGAQYVAIYEKMMETLAYECQ